MTVGDGDIVHADRHGAVGVPQDVVRDLPDAAAGLRERDAALLETCRTPGADIGNLLTLLSGRTAAKRREERRVRKECVSTGITRWSRYHYTQNATCHILSAVIILVLPCNTRST